MAHKNKEIQPAKDEESYVLLRGLNPGQYRESSLFIYAFVVSALHCLMMGYNLVDKCTFKYEKKNGRNRAQIED